jgi:hypothetical protein
MLARETGRVVKLRRLGPQKIYEKKPQRAEEKSASSRDPL